MCRLIVDSINVYLILVYCLFVYNLGVFTEIADEAPAGSARAAKFSRFGTAAAVLIQPGLLQGPSVCLLSKRTCFSMFVTSNKHEVKVASVIEGEGLRCWRAVHVSHPMSMFVPSWISAVEGTEFSERAFLMHERDLQRLIEEVGLWSLRGLQYLEPMDSDPHRLRLREVRRIWAAESAFGDETPHLVMEDEQGVQFVHVGNVSSIKLKHQIWPRD